MERGKFQRDMRELSGVVELFYILIVVMVLVKILTAVHLERIHFAVLYILPEQT